MIAKRKRLLAVKQHTQLHTRICTYIYVHSTDCIYTGASKSHLERLFFYNLSSFYAFLFLVTFLKSHSFVGQIYMDTARPAVRYVYTYTISQ